MNTPKKDCFAYVDKGNGRVTCTALKDLYCVRDGKCNFYKKSNKNCQKNLCEKESED